MSTSESSSSSPHELLALDDLDEGFAFFDALFRFLTLAAAAGTLAAGTKWF